jgi:uncharacterized protein
VQVESWAPLRPIVPRGTGSAQKWTPPPCSARLTRWSGIRDRTERLFRFRYRIEIYTPAVARRYGYYVLPFLLGSELVGRFDLKADRGAGQLVVQAAWVEDQWATTSTEADIALAAKEELSAMALWLGLDNGVVVAPKGNLALNAW